MSNHIHLAISYNVFTWSYSDKPFAQLILTKQPAYQQYTNLQNTDTKQEYGSSEDEEVQQILNHTQHTDTDDETN
jgi:hypothetical protein